MAPRASQAAGLNRILLPAGFGIWRRGLRVASPGAGPVSRIARETSSGGGHRATAPRPPRWPACWESDRWELSYGLFFSAPESIHERSSNPTAMKFVARVVELGRTIHAWFFDKVKTRVVLQEVTNLNLFFSVLEPLTQPDFIARLKQQQHALRRMLIRIQTIRETSFISSGYIIAEATTCLLAIGLILAEIHPFYESVFIVGLITFLLTFLVILIRDLDNPFGYYEESSAEDVSLHPLEDFITRIEAIVVEDDHHAGERQAKRAPAVLQQTL